MSLSTNLGTTEVAVEMPITAPSVPQRSASRPRQKRKSKPKLIMNDDALSKSRLRSLPPGWLRQYDIIHKRYFYVDIRVKETPVSTWRFPAGIPISDETAVSLQSIETEKFIPPTSNPPPRARKVVTSSETVPEKEETADAKIQANVPILANSGAFEPNASEATLSSEELFKVQPPSNPTLAGSAPPRDRKLSISPPMIRRKAVPEPITSPSSSEFLQQLYDLDLDSAEAADAILSLAFPIVIDSSDPLYESPEDSSSSSGSSSGHSFSDTDSVWTLTL